MDDQNNTTNETKQVARRVCPHVDEEGNVFFLRQRGSEYTSELN